MLNACAINNRTTPTHHTHRALAAGAARGVLGPLGKRLPLEVTISLRRTMFLWFSTLRILISRIAVIGNCSPGEGKHSHPRVHMGKGERGSGRLREAPLRESTAGVLGAHLAHPFLLVVHPHPLERHELLRLLVLRLVDLPARAQGQDTHTRSQHTSGWRAPGRGGGRGGGGGMGGVDIISMLGRSAPIGPLSHLFHLLKQLDRT